jgi:hypothetical protein
MVMLEPDGAAVTAAAMCRRAIFGSCPARRWGLARVGQ